MGPGKRELRDMRRGAQGHRPESHEPSILTHVVNCVLSRPRAVSSGMRSIPTRQVLRKRSSPSNGEPLIRAALKEVGSRCACLAEESCHPSGTEPQEAQHYAAGDHDRREHQPTYDHGDDGLNPFQVQRFLRRHEPRDQSQ